VRLLLLAGEGPYFKNNTYYDGSLFDSTARARTGEYFAALGGMDLSQLRILDGPLAGRPALVPKRGIGPHLSSYTVEAILAETRHEVELFGLDGVWDGDREPAIDPDLVLLSTTFICDDRSLRLALGWVHDRFPITRLVLGGQYSNLKYAQILARYPDVDLIVRGDGERAIPALLDAIDAGLDLGDVPNLVTRRSDGSLRVSPIEYVDLDAQPSPRYCGEHPIVPYESMRGCPFSCKFCSFPAASPLWRYKSARKIRDDWLRYADENGARHIRAMDSTFTVPPRRLHELLPMLDGSPVTWEAYTRANVLKNAESVARLAEARCTELSIGFESMSPSTLEHMNKKVTARQNRIAHEVLRDGAIDYRISFMAGYPGESPADYSATHDFLVDEFTGHFMLSVFSIVDETMPVWHDADRFGLRVLDQDNPDYSWRHDGMTVDTARTLVRQTLDDVRWGSENAVLLLWQTEWQRPLLPGRGRRTNLRVEKLVERLAMLPHDVPDPNAGCDRAVSLLTELERLGIARFPAKDADHIGAHSQPTERRRFAAPA
jgi:tRNA A37 methylthiotransferase MiaB